MEGLKREEGRAWKDEERGELKSRKQALLWKEGRRSRRCMEGGSKVGKWKLWKSGRDLGWKNVW